MSSSNFYFCRRAGCIDKGFTILLLAETEDYNKVLEILDKAANLLGNYLRIAKILIWKPGAQHPEQRAINGKVEVILYKV